MSSLSPNQITAEQLASAPVIADPYPFYAALREQSPLYGYRDFPPGTVPGDDEAPPAWAVLAHDQVTEVAKHPEIFSSRDPLQEASGAPTLMLVNHDDPEHRDLRNRVQHFFTTSAVAQHADWLTATCQQLITQMINQEVDVMQGIAANLPAMMMARLLGMPHEDHPRFRQWATAFMLSAPLSPTERSQSNSDMFAYFTDKVTNAATADKNDPAQSHFIQQLLKDTDQQPGLSVEQVIRFCFTLLVAGAETTTGLIGNLFWMAATQPEAFTQLRQDKQLIDAFIEETLRIAGPPQRLFRIATQDTVLGQAQIKAGDWVAVFFSAANHDPNVWDDPEVFRLDRPKPKTHYTFGHGVHQCLGAMLVRLEARAVMNALCDADVQVTYTEGAFRRQTATQLSYALDQCRITLRQTGR